jgi:hypothetical protein
MTSELRDFRRLPAFTNKNPAYIGNILSHCKDIKVEYMIYKLVVTLRASSRNSSRQNPIVQGRNSPLGTPEAVVIP